MAVSSITSFAEVNPPSSPYYSLQLTLNEYSVLNVAEMDGLLKYGGSGDFKVNMTRAGTNEVVWTVRIENHRLMELLGVFVGEKTIKLVQALDLSNLDSNQKIALQTVKSLTEKMERAQANPIWEPVRIQGSLARQGNDWFLQSGQGAFRLTGTDLIDDQSQDGKQCIVEGFTKIPGELEVSRFIPKRQNTLELFVMSLCPFGQRAETMILNSFATTNANARIDLEVRYLFYKQKNAGAEVFTSLHGENEVVENLVQMVIRDRYQKDFFPYLRLRAEKGGAPWKDLAVQAGLLPDGIMEVERAVISQREELISQEYAYATSRYDITDGSPTYVWEGERVPDLKQVKALSHIAGSSQEACAQ